MEFQYCLQSQKDSEIVVHEKQAPFHVHLGRAEEMQISAD